MSDHDKVSPGEIETGTAGRACDACHKKKTKCDMQQPVCGLCRRTNKECHFPSTRKRPSRQEPSVRAKLQKVNGNLDRLVELLEANPGLGDESLKNIISNKVLSSSPTDTKGSPFVSTNTGNAGPSVSGDGKSSRSPPLTTRKFGINTLVSRELAEHLIDLYFEWIQPWLPMLHKPTFLRWSSQMLASGEDALASVSPNEKVLLHSMFALSARFSDHIALTGLSPKEKGDKFIKAAEYWFKLVRDAEEFDLAFLKAAILVAYYHYANGFPKRGWYVSHLCIRGCYELGLHQIDEDSDDNEEENDLNNSFVEKESLRRVFWAIFEIDSFGSIIKRKPFAIDWRHIEVRLPVSDVAWFAGQPVKSPKFRSGPDCWKVLRDSPNQDERAWSLLAKAFVGHVFDLMLFKEGVTTEQLTTAEHNLSCFKLAMPSELQMTSHQWPGMSFPPAKKNWIISTHLYLAMSAFVLTRMPIIGLPPSPTDETHSKDVAAYTNRLLELNDILRRWSADSIPYCHPCIACTILTYDESLVKLLPPSATVDAYRDLSGLILSRIANWWTLSAVLLRVRDLAFNYQTSDEETRAELVRQYPVYFEREIRQNRKSSVEEAQKALTPSSSTNSPPNNSSNLSSTQNFRSIDQSLSPEMPQTSSSFLSTSQQLLQKDRQQFQQQQPTPPVTQASTRASSSFDPFYHPDVSAATMEAFPNYNSFPNTNSSPEDIDALFSGFLQEPWWQDFGPVNFVA